MSQSEAALYDLRSMSSWFGIGLIIAVGYIDTGNFQTGVQGGSAYQYAMLFVVLASSLIAMLFQYLSLKLGIASERDLAQACHDAYHPKLCVFLWLTTEIAIIATDVAELTGVSIGLFLLFGLPLWAGCLITAGDVFFLMALENRSVRWVEISVALMTLTIFVILIYVIALAQPDWAAVFMGFLPSTPLVTNSGELLTAVATLGAVIMPHNLFLHSSIVQTRAYERTVEGKRQAIHYASIDSFVSLSLAMLINAAIVILSGAIFYVHGEQDVVLLQNAYQLLSPALGVQAASTVFAIAIIASGLQATLTGTLAGQIVAEGFIELKLKPWQRRLCTRLLAIVPAIFVLSFVGNSATGSLLILSQVVLSLQLTFSLVPLVHFTSFEKFVGKDFVNPRWLTILCVILVFLVALMNLLLIVEFSISPSLT